MRPRLRRLVPLLCAVSACSESSVPTTRDAGPRPDQGEPAPVLRPDFLPCPSGWTEETIPDGLEVCEPWTNRGPIEWECPAGWVEVKDGLVDACHPGDDWVPVNRPCPEGWFKETEAGPPGCRPYPNQGPRACAPYEVHVPGTAECTRIAPPCPSGDFAEDLPAERVVYVKTTGESGDGSFDRPFVGLEQVRFDALPIGTVVALSKGEHEGNLILNRRVTLWGACPDETRLRGNPRNPGPVVGVSGGVTTLRRLQVEGPRSEGVLATGSSELIVEGVVVDRAVGIGISATQRAQVDISRSIIRETLPYLTPPRDFGLGLLVSQEATGHLRDSLISGNREAGIRVSSGSELTIEDSVIAGTRTNSVFLEGFGAVVQLGARTTLRRVAVYDNTLGGLVAFDGGRLVVEDSEVRGTLPVAGSEPGGYGVWVESSDGSETSAELVGLSSVENRTAAIYANGNGAFISAIQSRTYGTRAAARGEFGGFGFLAARRARLRIQRSSSSSEGDASVQLNQGAQVELDQIDIEIAREGDNGDQNLFGIAATSESEVEGEQIRVRGRKGLAVAVNRGASANLRHVVVDAIEPSTPPGDGDLSGLSVIGDGRIDVEGFLLTDVATGAGVLAQEGQLKLRNGGMRRTGLASVFQTEGRVELEQVVFRQGRSAAIASFGGLLELKRSVVSGFEADVTGAFGRGLELQAGAEARVEDSLFLANQDIAITAYDSGSRLQLTNAIIRNTRPETRSGGRGRGLLVENGASARLNKVRVEEGSDFGIVATLGASLEASDILVRGVARPPCTAEGCDGNASGIGITSGSTSAVTRAELRDNDRCGLFVAEDASDASRQGSRLTLTSGFVTGNGTAACVQVDGFDLATISAEEVTYDGNGQTIEFTSLPIPRPTARRPRE